MYVSRFLTASEIPLNLSIDVETTMIFVKGRLRSTIFKSAESVHLILLGYLAETIRCDMLAVSQSVNHPLILV